MSTLLLLLAVTTARALIALVLAAPLAAWSGWAAASTHPGAARARACLRLLAATPIAAIGVALGALGHAPGEGTLLAALVLGAYAPLALAVAEAREGAGARLERDALALGLAPRVVLARLVLPTLAPRLGAAGLRVGARLVGETGLFLVLAGHAAVDAALGPLLFLGRGDALAGASALVLVCAGLALAAERLARRSRA